jgi:hypothetical protein
MAEVNQEIPSLPFSLLGEFIIEFERICFLLRNGITNSLGIHGERQKETIELLLLKLTANPLLEMFISVKRSAYSLSAREDDVLDSIALEMGELIKCRNDYLHGTWFRPNDKDKFGTLESVPGIRKKKYKGRVVLNYMDLSAEEFRPKINQCTSLIQSIGHFEMYRGKDEFDSHFPDAE